MIIIITRNNVPWGLDSAIFSANWHSPEAGTHGYAPSCLVHNNDNNDSNNNNGNENNNNY